MRPSRPALFLALTLSAAGCVPAAEDVPTGTTIPEAMQGRWALAPAECAGGAAAKGLVEIGATTLRFYESRATLTTATERTPTHFRGEFAFAGEGMIWTRDEILDLGDGGTRLVRREYGATAQPAPAVYTACD